MTNSETQTEARKASHKRSAAGKAGAGKARAKAAPALRPDQDDGDAGAPAAIMDERHKRGLVLIVVGLLLIGGWLAILSTYRWVVSPPVLFLWTGWLAVLLTARFLWNTAMSVAHDDTSAIEEEEFWKPVGPRDELLYEKRALLKALKEIEFDHQMGKMSDQDAAELSSFYRTRAIEIIKALESSGGDEKLSVSEKIDRELKARLSLAGASSKGAASAERGKARAAGKGKATAGEGGGASKPAPKASDAAASDAASERTDDRDDEVKTSEAPAAEGDGAAAASADHDMPAARAEVGR